jgi:CubicO group peptidase (beta-lactamase class C family)
MPHAVTSLRKNVFSTVLLLSILLPFSFAAAQKSTTAPPDMDQARLDAIHTRLQELVDNQQIPGAVYLIAHHGRVAAYDAVGWANVEEKKPMRKDSIFQVMSMTKNFTDVGIMMLVEDGRIDLRRPVEYYLPEFKNILVEETLPDGSIITRKPKLPPTVWQLMDHTSGLDGDPSGALEDNPRTLRVPLAEAVKFYGQSRLLFEPGTRWKYSNLGIATLGRIIEVITGEEYVSYISKRLFQPLGMNDSFFLAPADKKDRIALDGRLVRSGSEIIAGDPALYRAGAKYPAPEFGLYSTAADLLRFYQMLLNGGTLDSRRYLSRQSVETMTRIFTPDVKPSGWLGGTGYGLTFEIVNQPEGTLLLHSPGTFGHGGAFGTEGWIDPKNDLIRIMLVQSSDSSGAAPRSIVMQMGEAAVLDGK